MLIHALPAGFPAAVLVVQHLHPQHDSLLPSLLRRRAHLPIRQAKHDDRIDSGAVYVAPPDFHLLVAAGFVELSRSKLVHFSRPSVDLLFESVAGEYGARAIGVILTGSGRDGATGIRAIKRVGGVTVIEDPASAAHPSMPEAARATGCVDHVVPLDRIAEMLVHLVTGSAPATPERTR